MCIIVIPAANVIIVIEASAAVSGLDFYHPRLYVIRRQGYYFAYLIFHCYSL